MRIINDGSDDDDDDDEDDDDDDDDDDHHDGFSFYDGNNSITDSHCHYHDSHTDMDFS